ncbi:MAG: outer membrane protein OmpA-like peptidoglycan-associated protein [Crocinitomicaceae bacterium]|jgi:outer membrane protein OmpA-like peptidoglycan-associated protein
MQFTATALLYLLLSTSAVAQKKDSLGPNEYLFDFNMKYTGSEFRVDPNYQYLLDQLVEQINKDSIHVHVRGHVCCGPSYRLSKKRARKAYEYLIRAGADKSKLSFEGYSDQRPLIWPEDSNEAELANRRVDFVIRPIE